MEDLLKKPVTLKELAKLTGESRTNIKFKIREMIKDGYNIVEDKKRGKTIYYISKTPQRNHNPFNITHLNRFGVIGDTHLGSRYAEEEALEAYYERLKKENIKIVFHAGDITDGINVYPGHINDLVVWGVDEQAEYTAEVYPQIKGIKTYFITGNHDLKALQKTGIDVGKLINGYRPDLVYLGQYYRRLNIDNILIDLVHPDGGAVYSLSYPAQKYLRNSPPETHPDINLMGHHHTMFYGKIQGVHNLNVGCFMGTTDFLRRKGIRADIGGWIVEIKKKNGKIKELYPRWIDLS